MKIFLKNYARGRSSAPCCGNIVAFGREKIEAAIGLRVRGKYQSRINQAGVFGRFLIEWRINRIVKGKMKKLVSPYAVFARTGIVARY